MIRALTQAALDAAFNGAVRVFWQSKSGDLKEYIVYSRTGSGNDDFFADDQPLVESQGITVKYYYQADKLNTQTGRTQIKSREDLIISALKSAGFELDEEPFDAGDIDDIGYKTTVFEFTYEKVI